MQSESQPLLPNHHHYVVPHLDTKAVMALIINKMIGTGVFSTPSLIFQLCGNIGTTMVLWLLGGFITFCGLSVYLEFGLELPFNGGEKNYLQRVWKWPKYLIENVYAFQIVLLGFSSGNSYAMGKYLLFIVGITDNDWLARWIGVGVISFAIYLHSYHSNLSTKIFTILGFIKVLILVIIITLGFLVKFKIFFNLNNELNNDNFKNIWENYENFQGNGYNLSVGLLQVIYSFKGWENANYVLSEIKNPGKTLKIAAPLSVLLTTICYFLVILSYYLVIPKDEFKDSGVLIAGIFFQKIFKSNSITFKILPILISLSNFGNVLAVSFSHSRINQELAKENLIPFSSIFKILKNSMLLHWLVTVLVLIIPPNGDIYQLVVNLYSYPGTWINIFVTIGLFYLQFNRVKENWGFKTDHKWHSYFGISLVFLISNLFLALFPFLPPPDNFKSNGGYPYYVFPVTGVGVLFSGVIYWAFRHLLKNDDK